MLFPRCGKVLVIDDQVEEAVPLLNLLGKKGGFYNVLFRQFIRIAGISL